MNSVASYHHPRSECSSTPYCHPDDFDRMISSAKSILDQAPPPTLREILGAYRSKGDGDRDMLLAMLNAKAAEDQFTITLPTIPNLRRATLMEVMTTIHLTHNLRVRVSNDLDVCTRAVAAALHVALLRICHRLIQGPSSWIIHENDVVHLSHRILLLQPFTKRHIHLNNFLPPRIHRPTAVTLQNTHRAQELPWPLAPCYHQGQDEKLTRMHPKNGINCRNQFI
ncbi:uncharacterized protein LACBIDRAFT_301745 [Laccaria bicolor S238N-H82]|uniref:Predicted protein n=1 Tax=Laccaria bicolor (strain S238N-H82 / ATCC MYA-4686) TaxID=486041 RepID=B0CP66_LACBS|nr:uncharacterized protein LACBIDRAFT_301745 [Laccaria bicolor S238N-H82]EDR16050.1 predicted protein [Laccaria bicolor S238N-H82]|eukprot:XP_001874258.1 predicted protein [Laccaria bicolor S238N-H82]